MPLTSRHALEIPENIEWRVAEYDGEEEAVGTRAILDIHESFHSFDPTGREGKPRDRFPKPKMAAAKKAALKGKK